MSYFDMRKMHPLADISIVNGEPTTNSWGFASFITNAIIEQGPDGEAAGAMRAILKDQPVDVDLLIDEVLMQNDSGIRLAQNRIAVAIDDKCREEFSE